MYLSCISKFLHTVSSVYAYNNNKHEHIRCFFAFVPSLSLDSKYTLLRLALEQTTNVRQASTSRKRDKSKAFRDFPMRAVTETTPTTTTTTTRMTSTHLPVTRAKLSGYERAEKARVGEEDGICWAVQKTICIIIHGTSVWYLQTM